jgi:hypothetical protein
MSGQNSVLDRVRNACDPYLIHNGFSTHPAKGKVVGAWSWQVVSIRDFRLPPRYWWDLRSSGFRCPETSVKNYHSTLRNNPDERRSQVVSMLSHSAFISAHFFYFSGVALFVFVHQARLQTSLVVWSAPLPGPSHGAAVLRVLMVCCRRSVGASTACSSGPWESKWGATLWSSAGMRALLYSHPPVTATLSMSSKTHYMHIYDPNLAVQIQYTLAGDKSTCKDKLVPVHAMKAYGGVEV